MRACDDYGVYFFLSIIHGSMRESDDRGRSLQWLCLSLVSLSSLFLRPRFFPSPSFSLNCSLQALDFLIRQLKVSRLVGDLRVARNLSSLPLSRRSQECLAIYLIVTVTRKQTGRLTKSSVVSLSLSLFEHYFTSYKLPNDTVQLARTNKQIEPACPRLLPANAGRFTSLIIAISFLPSLRRD